MYDTGFYELNGKRVALRKTYISNENKYKDYIGKIVSILDTTGELYVFLFEDNTNRAYRIKRKEYAKYELLRVLED